MSHLQNVLTGRSPQPRRVMLYGVHGVGKSSWASCAPQPIFLPTEDGLGEIDCARFPLATSFGDVMQGISALYADPHDYHTIVIDSLDWLERLVWSDLCRSKGKDSIEDFGYAKGYTLALDLWREVLDGLSALRNDRRMMVILLAHAKIERYENPETDSYDRYSPRLHKAASATIQEWCDEVFFATYRVHTRSVDEGFGRTGTKAMGSGERIVRTTERPAHLAKNRLDLPEELPLSFEAYAQYFRTAA